MPIYAVLQCKGIWQYLLLNFKENLTNFWEISRNFATINVLLMTKYSSICFVIWFFFKSKPRKYRIYCKHRSNGLMIGPQSTRGSIFIQDNVWFIQYEGIIEHSILGKIIDYICHIIWPIYYMTWMKCRIWPACIWDHVESSSFVCFIS